MEENKVETTEVKQDVTSAMEECRKQYSQLCAEKGQLHYMKHQNEVNFKNRDEELTRELEKVNKRAEYLNNEQVAKAKADKEQSNGQAS